MGPRYLKLFTLVSTWLSVSIFRLMSWNPNFLKVNFQLKFLCRFRETGDYILCILVVVCHEVSGVRWQELEYQSISGLSCRLKFTGMEQVCLWSLYPYSFGGISEGIRQDHKRKRKDSVARTQPFSPSFSTSNTSENSLKLTNTFIPVCKADTSCRLIKAP